MTHDHTNTDHGRGPAASLASTWNALCCLSAAHAWFWLARSGPVDAAPAIGLVLLDALPKFLDAFGAGACGHG